MHDINLLNLDLIPFKERSANHPELTALIALHFDAFIKNKYKIKEPVTFSCSSLKVGKKEPFKQTEKQLHTSKLPYFTTSIAATSSLNIHYANSLITQKKIWLHFLNKYFYPTKIVHDNKALFCIKAEAAGSDDHPDIKVSVIMTAYNAEKTIFSAVKSLLDQTHKNLEIIIIDDCSTDKTEYEIDKLKKTDSRIKVKRIMCNSGAYICRNIALNLVSGDYIVCHDADDYAFPDRIAIQLTKLLETGQAACICHMLRMSELGEITRLSAISNNSSDGWKKLCHISPMYDVEFFKSKLGYWDSVRAGGDSEILNRTYKLTNRKISVINDVLLLALDSETNTTRDDSIGLFSKKGHDVRNRYKNNWTSWHNNSNDLYLPFPLINRPFLAPQELLQ